MTRSSLNRMVLVLLLCSFMGCSGNEAEIPVQRRCVVEINGQIVKTVEAENRNDCYAQVSFGSGNCEVYSEHFEAGDNQLRQVFGASSVVNKETCKIPAD